MFGPSNPPPGQGLWVRVANIRSAVGHCSVPRMSLIFGAGICIAALAPFFGHADGSALGQWHVDDGSRLFVGWVGSILRFTCFFRPLMSCDAALMGSRPCHRGRCVCGQGKLVGAYGQPDWACMVALGGSDSRARFRARTRGSDFG